MTHIALVVAIDANILIPHRQWMRMREEPFQQILTRRQCFNNFHLDEEKKAELERRQRVVKLKPLTTFVQLINVPFFPWCSRFILTSINVEIAPRHSPFTYGKYTCNKSSLCRLEICTLWLGFRAEEMGSNNNINKSWTPTKHATK